MKVCVTSFSKFSDVSSLIKKLVPTTTSSNPNSTMLFPGTTIQLSCTSSGVPQPEVFWYRDGVMLSNGTGGVTIQINNNTSELSVSDTMGQQGGKYNCSGINVAGMSSEILEVECKFILGNGHAFTWES